MVKGKIDRAIGRLVYNLSHRGMIYGLREGEVKVVRGSKEG